MSVLYVIGKTWRENGASCCVVVENLNRYLYVVPRVPEGRPKIAQMTPDESGEMNYGWRNARSYDESCSRVASPRRETRNRLLQYLGLLDRNYTLDVPDMPRGVSQYLNLKHLAKYPMPALDIFEKSGKTFT